MFCHRSEGYGPPSSSVRLESIKSLPFSLPETQLLLAEMLLSAAVVGLALRLTGPRGRLAILTAILFVHLDLAGAYMGLFGALDLGSRIPRQTLRISLQAMLLLLILGSIGLGLWTLRRQAMRIAAAYFVVVALATVATEPLPRLASRTPAPAPPPVDTNAVSDEAPPLIIHLLFDGLLAPTAIRRDITGGRRPMRRCSAWPRATGFGSSSGPSAGIATPRPLSRT